MTLGRCLGAQREDWVVLLGSAGLIGLVQGRLVDEGSGWFGSLKKERMSSGPSQIASESLTMLNKVPNEFTVITIGNQPEVQNRANKWVKGCVNFRHFWERIRESGCGT